MATVADAVANNTAWYCTVMQSHGIPYEQTEQYWLARETVPTYYSNYVVLDPADHDAHMHRIDQSLQTIRAASWSVADCFSSLHHDAMIARGLELFIQAHWFAVPSPLDIAPNHHWRFEPIRSDAELLEWETLWKVWSPTPTPRMFGSDLLDARGVTFWRALENDQLVGGALTHGDSLHLGLSNVFLHGKSGPVDFMRCAVHAIQTATQPASPCIVGYHDVRGELEQFGAQALGPHTIWRLNPSR